MAHRLEPGPLGHPGHGRVGGAAVTRAVMMEKLRGWTQDELSVHAGSTVTVTTGELRLIVDGVEHRVGAGATATFSATVPNSYHGAGETGCEMLATTHLPPGGRS
jgi:quercetin dioxygenase-like cupin family protein